MTTNTPPADYTIRVNALSDTLDGEDFTENVEACPPPLPRELPDLRLRLLHDWRDDGMLAAITRAEYLHNASASGMPLHLRELAHGGGLTRGDGLVNWERTTLERARLWWVAKPMCELLFAASHGVPDDITFADLPAPDDPNLRTGFAVFEVPFIGHTTEGDPIPVMGVAWGPVTLPDGRRGMSVSSYGAFAAPHTDGQFAIGFANPDGDVATAHELFFSPGERVVFPAGRVDWPEGDAVTVMPWPMEDTVAAGFAEDRRLLAALWTLLHQRGIATTTVRDADRPTRRRAERALPDHGEPSRVRLVTVRAIERSPTSEHDDDATPRRLTHRHLVSGFWRNQPCGPGNRQRRLTYINPFIRGPKDAPFVAKEVVNVWTR